KKEFIPNLNKLFIILELHKPENYYITASDLNAKHVNWKNANNNPRGITLKSWIENNNLTYKIRLLSIRYPSYFNGNFYLDIVIVGARHFILPCDSGHEAVKYRNDAINTQRLLCLKNELNDIRTDLKLELLSSINNYWKDKIGKILKNDSANMFPQLNSIFRKKDLAKIATLKIPSKSLILNNAEIDISNLKKDKNDHILINKISDNEYNFIIKLIRDHYFMGDIKYYGKRRSIVRRIGSFLPLKPPPKIYVSVTPLHLMTNSMINEETSSNYIDTNGYPIRSDLFEPISFGSEVRLLALEQELQELREQISTIVKNNKLSKYASVASLSNGEDNLKSLSVPLPPPPPPPPPLPLLLLPPTTPHIARRASLQDHKIEDRKKILFSVKKSTGDMLKDIDNVKLRPVARSPGGHPMRMKREKSPCNDLQEILRRRYIAMQSPDSKNSSANLAMDNSF
ncbi:hypothetical protein ALC53_00608, partial [Atta colombica]